MRPKRSSARPRIVVRDVGPRGASGGLIALSAQKAHNGSVAAKRLLAALGLALLGIALSSCSASTISCAAPLVSNTIRIQVTGRTEIVDNVGYCPGSTCTPRPMELQLNGSTPTPLPASHHGSVWSMAISSARPHFARVGAFDRSGAAVANTRVQLTWKDEGTATCHGPYSTSGTLNVSG